MSQSVNVAPGRGEVSNDPVLPPHRYADKHLAAAPGQTSRAYKTQPLWILAHRFGADDLAGT